MSYPISAPVTFDNTNNGDELDFNAQSGVASQNVIKDFVTTTAGDLLYRKDGADNYLERLAIGTEGQLLTVALGLPAWKDDASVGTQAVFHAQVTSSVVAFPTSKTGGAAVDVWNSMTNSYVTWNAVVDPDNVFSVANGTFTAPATGIYSLSAQVTVDSGAGTNTGVGMGASVGGGPSGKAARQIRLYNSTTATVIGISTTQAAGSNDNQAVVALSVANVDLNSGDEVVLQFRHDHSTNTTIKIGATSQPTQTYFSGKRVK